MIEQIELHAIILKRSFQARIQGINQHTLQEYIEALDAGASFPPIDVYRTGSGELLLVDGWHRYHAHKACCLPTIKAQIHNGEEAEAQDYALYRANRMNGQRLSKKDVRELTRIAVADPRFAEMSSRQLAKAINVSQPTIVRVRKEMGILRHSTSLRIDLNMDEVSDHNVRQINESRAARLIKKSHKNLDEIQAFYEFADKHELQELVRHLNKFIEEIS